MIVPLLGLRDRLVVAAFALDVHAPSLFAQSRFALAIDIALVAQMDGKTLRSIDLDRARLHLKWKVAAYNLLRPVYLNETGVKSF